MKKNLWIIFGAMLSTSLLAQPVTNEPPAAPLQSPGPAAVTPAPAAPAAEVKPAAPAETKTKAATPSAKKSAKKPAPKKVKPQVELRTVPLVPGPAVVDANNVNVRGQGRLRGEVITRLTKGDAVTVLEEIKLKESAPDEPSAWAKILLPTNTPVWVSGLFIDRTAKTVTARKLNLRAGAGENYSVVGQLKKGDTITELDTKGDWIKIQPPADAYGFIAARYLKQEPVSTGPAIAAATPSTTAPATETKPEAAVPPPTTAAVPDAPAVAAAPTETPAPATTPAPVAGATETAPTTNTTAMAEAPTEEADQPDSDEPPPKRVVQREGLVRGTVSIQAPTPFALVSPDNGRLIDYLYTTARELDLSQYKGMRIIVTGEEALDDRWGNTPVITIQKITVLE